MYVYIYVCVWFVQANLTTNEATTKGEEQMSPPPGLLNVELMLHQKLALSWMRRREVNSYDVLSKSVDVTNSSGCSK